MFFVNLDKYSFFSLSILLILFSISAIVGCGGGNSGSALDPITIVPTATGIPTIVFPSDPNNCMVYFYTTNPVVIRGSIHVWELDKVSGKVIEGSSATVLPTNDGGNASGEFKRNWSFQAETYNANNEKLGSSTFSTSDQQTGEIVIDSQGSTAFTPTANPNATPTSVQPTPAPGQPTWTPTVTPAAPTVGPGTPTTVPTATLTPGPGTPTTVPPTATNTPVTGSTATPTATTTATNTPTTVPTVTIISHDPNFAICNYKPTKVYCDGINIFYNNYNSEVVKLNTSGTEISRKQIPGLTNSLWGIADNGTTIFVVNGFGFFHILNKTDLEIQDQHAIPANCGGSCIYGGLINIVDADNCKVNRYNTSSPYTQGTSFGSYGTGNGQFGQLGGICCDTNGNMYITDGKNKRIVVFDSNGTFVKNFGSATSYFTDVSQVNVNGKSFCFATADSNSIKIYTDENFSKTVTTDDCAGVTNKNNGDNTIDIYYANTNSKKIGKIKIQI